MSSAVARLAKPDMRGHLAKKLKLHLFLAIAGGIASTGVYHMLVTKPRKDAYRNFFATYDPDKDWERMKRAGVFKCAPLAGQGEEDKEELREAQKAKLEKQLGKTFG